MSLSHSIAGVITEAARLIAEADALLIAAGAGMGVDSGLPDFRGPEGFWRAYPPFRGKAFHEISTPHWFETDPQLAWGFFGHRLGLYRNTQPHAGFAILHQWAQRPPGGAFVFTSNVDGQFQKAGFKENILYECHGTIHRLQCTTPCSRKLWSAEAVNIEIDPATFRANGNLPHCPHCGAVARPNVLMFRDRTWLATRSDQQARRYTSWLERVRGKHIVAIELGAGVDIPTVRLEAEDQCQTVIRINPRDCDAPLNGVAIPMGAREALYAIDDVLKR
ncbi:NAD-dependent protein deacetylase [Planctopirus ephydatiae]|uniref:protein acetyllysine N-acetyltransferase n=1 Tax=Planctopirus ephydatiae TaxID=2528019 RepID=A0A518GL74_9PLAN|nr:Sir2 family NAD-dependent protein deacetylase [Planctopirus ephydatiae]QDV29403.1 NAD-dependent protein deacetylase [Planctopirus ephydatiae]